MIIIMVKELFDATGNIKVFDLTDHNDFEIDTYIAI